MLYNLEELKQWIKKNQLVKLTKDSSSIRPELWVMIIRSKSIQQLENDSWVRQEIEKDFPLSSERLGKDKWVNQEAEKISELLNIFRKEVEKEKAIETKLNSVKQKLKAWESLISGRHQR